jgi:hypothetical protein
MKEVFAGVTTGSSSSTKASHRRRNFSKSGPPFSFSCFRVGDEDLAPYLEREGHQSRLGAGRDIGPDHFLIRDLQFLGLDVLQPAVQFTGGGGSIEDAGQDAVEVREQGVLVGDAQRQKPVRLERRAPPSRSSRLASPRPPFVSPTVASTRTTTEKHRPGRSPGRCFRVRIIRRRRRPGPRCPPE